MLVARTHGFSHAAFVVALVVALVVVACASQARAAPPTFALRYERDADAFGCLTARELRTAVSERIGRDPFRARASQAIGVRVERTQYGYVAEMSLYEDGVLRGERLLSSTGSDCAPLGDALTFTLAIVIDPTHGLSAKPASRDGGPSEKLAPLLVRLPARAYAPVPVLTGDPKAPRYPSPADDDPTRLTYELGVGGFAGLGAAPGALGGGLVQAAARSGPLSFHLELRAELPGSVPVEGVADYPDAVVGGTLLAVAMQPCFRLGGGPFLPNGHSAWAAVCGVAQTGAMLVAAANLRDESVGVAPWLSFGARMHLDLPVQRWLAARGFVEVLVPVTRVTLTDRVTGFAIYEPPWVTVSVGLSAVALLL